MPEENEEALCFLEYYDRHNVRSHMCFTCCNCDAVDTIGNSVFHGQAPTADMMTDLRADFLDRLRVPTIGGARKLKITLLIPNIFIGLVLALGSFHFLLALITPFILMSGVNVLYKLWIRGVVSGSLFFSSVPSILLWIYIISVLYITPSCSYELIAAVHVGFLILTYCIYKTQSTDPGILPPRYTLSSDEGHPVALPVDACRKCGASTAELSMHCR